MPYISPVGKLTIRCILGNSTMFALLEIGIPLAFLFILVSSVISWVAFRRTNKQDRQIFELRKEIDAAKRALAEIRKGSASEDRKAAEAEVRQERQEDGGDDSSLQTAAMEPPPVEAPPPADPTPPPAGDAPKTVWTNLPNKAPRVTQGRDEAAKDKAVGSNEPSTPEAKASEGQTEETTASASSPDAGATGDTTNDAEPAAQEQQAARGMDVDFQTDKRSIEHNFGARLPVWIGGIAFALGGLFLVKYSIDNNLMSPLVRVLLGGLLGLGLLAGGDVIRRRPDFANGRRIAQSLSGAGIAVLYLAIYAATSLYELISPALGFIGMSAVTATGITLSLRYGKPIALLGLIFGFITPALVQSNEPSAVILFAYLLLLSAGAMLLIRYKGWWDLALPTLGASLGWALLWIVGHYGDGMLTVGLYLLAIAALTAFFNQGQVQGQDKVTMPEFSGELNVQHAFGYLGLLGATGLIFLAVRFSLFGHAEWGLSAIMALGGIYLAYIDDARYRFLPWASLGLNALLLLSWNESDLTYYSGTLTLFAAIFSVSAYSLFWRADKAVPWAGLTTAASIGFYLLGYYKLHIAPARPELAVDSTLFWGGLALALASVAIYSVKRLQDHFKAEAQKEYLLAIFAVSATAFVSFAMVVLLDEKNLPLAFAAEVLAVAWISRRAEIAVLRPVTGILALVFAGLLVPQILLLIQLTAFSLVELRLPLQASVPLVEEPLIRLGLPALFFIGAAAFLRQKTDDWLVRGLEIAAIALGAVMGYYLTRQVMNLDENVLYVKAGFLERGIITNVLFLYGLFCFWAGRRFLRVAVSWSGAVLCAVGFFRIGYFDLFLYNPVWSHQEVPGWPLLNALILPFGLPIIWSLLTARELNFLSKSEAVATWTRFLKPIALLLAFVWMTLMIRQAFQGSYLDSFVAGNAEVYSYSVAWILFGIALLAAGIVTWDRSLRYASLGVMLLAIGKVFLYDTAELEGLYRVFSFFGLGFSLLGLSYVYTRFVFGGKEHADRPAVTGTASGDPQ